MPLTNISPPTQLDIQPNHELSASVKKRIESAWIDPIVKPQWVEGTSNFWYRKKVRDEKYVFFYVEPEEKRRKPAFKHDVLARALKDQGIEAEAEALPIRWIDLKLGDKCVRFEAGGKRWQWDEAANLKEYKGEIATEFLTAIEVEEPSSKESGKTAIIFKNDTAETLSIWWVDWHGKAKRYAAVNAGRSRKLDTYTGHTWRVCTEEDDKPIASFRARKYEATAVVQDTIEKTKLPKQDDEPEPTGVENKDKVFIRDFNVWARNESGNETQMSHDGSAGSFFRGKIRTSQDGNFAVVFRVTAEQEHKIHMVESSPKGQLQPKLRSLQYLKPGDTIEVERPHLFDLNEKAEVPTDGALFENPFKTYNLGWNREGAEYRFLHNRRGHKVIRIIGINTQGYVRIIHEESSDTFINYSQKMYYQLIKESDELLWTSERDGWNHLYLIDLKAGRTKAQITKGAWLVGEVEGLSEEDKQIWFQAYGLADDPYFKHLVRVDIDGSNLTVLTRGNATHSWQWSPCEKYFIDTWSRNDLAPCTALRLASNGEPILLLEEATFQGLTDVGWTTPERFAAPGRDGKTMIYGIIIRPSDFDHIKNYPVIEQIYAGPTDFNVPSEFLPLKEQHELADLGFIVVMIDGMGTNWRSKAFHDVCFKNLKDAGSPDRIAWMKAAKASRPWMDLERVGIFGGSAGGQNAMAALLWHGDFYKAAVADCGCHDNRMDKVWWNEQWMGWPIDQSYEDSSNVVHAEKLKGALMLVVSELDTNVDPASTMQVVNALNAAEKDYELLFLPGKEHCEGSHERFTTRRRHDFFVKHLMGVQPPDRNRT